MAPDNYGKRTGSCIIHFLKTFSSRSLMRNKITSLTDARISKVKFFAFENCGFNTE